MTDRFELTGGGALHGTVRVPGDKSISHRALLLGALARGTSHITGLSDGDDVHRTAAAVRAMGAAMDGTSITGGALHAPAHTIDVGNSGTSIRLLAGYCAALPWRTVLDGDASIAVRPMDRVVEPLRKMGADIDGRDGGARAPRNQNGGALHGIDFTLPMASAQVKSAILLAGIGAEGETVVREPVATRAHTEELLELAGAEIHTAPGVIRVRASTLHPFELAVPGDPSQAAFWIAGAAAIRGSELTVEEIYTGPARTGFVDVLRRMGADIETEPVGPHAARVHVRAAPLHGTTVDGNEIPSLDEVPALAVAAALAEGDTVFRNAGELRVKESDRIATVTAALQALGAAVEPTDDGLVVHGPASLRGAVVDSAGDHRIAMAAAIAAVAAEGETVITGFDAVATSYPRFAKDLHACR